MDKKLNRAILIFFTFLIIFIVIMFLSEYRNMEQLKIDYPNLPQDAYNLRKDNLVVWAIGLILQFLIPLLFLTSRLSQGISQWAGRRGGLISSGILYGIVFFTLMFLIKLPLNYYSSFILRHKYGLTSQSFLRWLELSIKGFVINDLVMTLFIWIPYYIIYRSPKSWWFQFGILLIPVIIFMVFISPTYIDPIYNKYTSIENEKLGKNIELLLEKAGIKDADIYMVDKSKDTNTMNAYMTGIYKSKRIVLWDTTINNLEEKEVLSITAHEIGHYVEGHIWKNILYACVGNFLLLYLVYISSNWVLDKSNFRFGFKSVFNYASLPLLILLINIYTFLGNPIFNNLSRSMEVEADKYEIILTEDREAAISAMEKLYNQSLGLPRTSTLYKLWYNSHPSLEERVNFYSNYEIE
ncbi:MAG: M48 family metallopeptidase [Tissierellaceae bacterium]|nr:M48 family metallopeptidase [Tissierellaceae bacterium]